MFQKVSWLFVYFVPAIFLYLDIVAPDNVYEFILFLDGLLIINYVYENGYLENDVKTIRKETNPTLRLSEDTIKAIDARFGIICVLRLFILGLLLSIYAYCSIQSGNGITPLYALLAVIILLQILYLIYNRIRNMANLFIIIPLSFIRFYGFLLPFVPVEHLFQFCIFSLLLYPLPKFLEFSMQDRYRKYFTILPKGNIDLFRVRYYLLLSLFYLITGYIMTLVYSRIFLLLAVFYFLYRLAGVLLLKNKHILKDFKNNFGRSS